MSDELERIVLGAAPPEWFDPRDGSPVIPDSWRPVLTAVEKYTAELRAERDSLVASLEATTPCEPCQRDDHDNCTGDCSSMCCALAAAERERDSLVASLEEAREERDKLAAEAEAFRTGMGNGVTILPTEWLDKERAELSELRARVEAAVVVVNNGRYSNIVVDNERISLLAILSPPEAPTDKGETP